MDEEDRKEQNAAIRFMNTLLILENLLMFDLVSSEYGTPDPRKWTEISKQQQVTFLEEQEKSRAIKRIERLVYNNYRPLVFGDLERGIKPLADLNEDGKVDEQEKALVYKLAGVQEEEILRFGKEVYYPILTGYKMQGVWQRLTDLREAQNTKKTR